MKLPKYMEFCIDKDNKLYSVEDFIFLEKNNINISPLCKFCRNPLFIKCRDNPKRKTHFSHYGNQSCSSIDYSEIFKHCSSIPKTQLEIENLKILIVIYSYYIYQSINNFLQTNISIQEFLEIFKTIPSSVYKIKDLCPSSFSYIWINQLKVRNNKTYIFTTTDTNLGLWEFCGEKNIIITIEEIPNHTLSYSYKFTDYTYLDNILLSIPSDFIISTFFELCEILNLKTYTTEELFKFILTKQSVY